LNQQQMAAQQQQEQAQNMEQAIAMSKTPLMDPTKNPQLNADLQSAAE